MSNQPADAKVLLLEKINHRFKRITKTKQASGLSNCLRDICLSVPGVVKVEVDSIDQAFTAIQKWKAPKVVFEGLWLTETMIKRLRTVFTDRQLFVHIHSNIPFLITEPMAFQSLQMYRRLEIGVIWNSRGGYNAFRNAKNQYFLPNVYAQEFHVELEKPEKEFLDVACFGSIRPLKNQVIQAIAAVNYADHIGKPMNFHMNIDRSETDNNEIVNALKGIFSMYPRHTLVPTQWVEQGKFIENLKTMDIGLQVSLSETFNIVAADYVAAGLPMVVSHEIYWAPLGCRAHCGNPLDINHMMESVAEGYYLEESRRLLRKTSDYGIKLWKEFTDAT